MFTTVPRGIQKLLVFEAVFQEARTRVALPQYLAVFVTQYTHFSGHNSFANNGMENKEESAVKKLGKAHQDHVFFDGEAFFANYAGDITLTPAGLQYLGMISWKPRNCFVSLPPESLQSLHRSG